MFCDSCGAQLQADQRFYSHCGKAIVGGAHLAYPAPGRVQQHLRLLGILWIAVSALNALGGFVVMVVAKAVLIRMSQMGGPPIPIDLIRPILTLVGLFLLAKAALGFAAGWGLIQRQAWARILTLVLGFLSLFNFPFGTALGVYTLWVLLPTQSEREYEALAEAA